MKYFENEESNEGKKDYRHDTHQDAVKSTTTNFSLDVSISSIHSPSDSMYLTMVVGIVVDLGVELRIDSF